MELRTKIVKEGSEEAPHDVSDEQDSLVLPWRRLNLTRTRAAPPIARDESFLYELFQPASRDSR